MKYEEAELAPEGEMRFTPERKLECLKREIKWRFKVYPTRVANKRMSLRQAKEEIAVMTSIMRDYEALVARIGESERLL